MNQGITIAGIVTAAILFIAWPHARAQTAGADPCPAANTQLDLNRCAEGELRKAEARLSDVLEALQHKLTDHQQIELLQEAQSAWLSYRDKECRLEASGSEGGSVHPMVLSFCLAGKAEARAQELAVRLNCTEGDMSCVR